MSTINTAAQTAQDDARSKTTGKFGEQGHTDPGQNLIAVPAGPRRGQHICSRCGRNVLDRGAAWTDRDGGLACGDGEAHTGCEAETVYALDLKDGDRIVLGAVQATVRGMHECIDGSGEHGANLWLTDAQFTSDQTVFSPNDERIPRLVTEPLTPTSSPTETCGVCGTVRYTEDCVECGGAVPFDTIGDAMGTTEEQYLAAMPTAGTPVYASNQLAAGTATVTAVGWNRIWGGPQFTVEMDKLKDGLRETVEMTAEDLYRLI